MLRKEIKLFVFLLIIFWHSQYVNATVVKAIVYLYDVLLYSPILNSFNSYAKSKKLNVTLELEALTTSNASLPLNNYVTNIDSLLERKSEKFDLYFYHNAFIDNFGPHYENLREWLPENHIDMFDVGIISNTCTYNDALVGLPVLIYISTLYSNNQLLTKHNRKIPQSWDDLIDTAKYIYEKEKENNSKTDIITYNGLFDDSDYGFLSIYEILNSYRDSNSSPYPSIKSKGAKESLKMLKRLKNEIGSDYLFRLHEEETINYITNGKAIFLKFWYRDYNSTYKATALPGWKNGVSGSVANSINIGVSKYITTEKKKAAMEVVKYLTLKDTQKKYIIPYHGFSGIGELYNDEEVCRIIDCDVAKNAQPFSSLKINNTGAYDLNTYINNYRNNIYQYIYGNETLENIIKNIDDMTKFYTLNINGEDFIGGLIVFIFFFIFVIVICSFVPFLFMKKYKYQFKGLPIPFWIVAIVGSLTILCTVLTFYGEVNFIKCHLKTILFLYGFTFILFPILYFLIINFPEENKISNWIMEFKYQILLATIGVTTLINVLLLISPIVIEEVIIPKGENFKRCGPLKSFGKNIYIFVTFLQAVILFSILVLIFLEWNLNEIFNDVRYFLATVFTTILSIGIYSILIKIDINNYICYNILLIIVLIIYSLSSLLLICGLKVIFEVLNIKTENVYNKKESTDESTEENIKVNCIENTDENINEIKGENSSNKKENNTENSI